MTDSKGNMLKSRGLPAYFAMCFSGVEWTQDLEANLRERWLSLPATVRARCHGCSLRVHRISQDEVGCRLAVKLAGKGPLTLHGHGADAESALADAFASLLDRLGRSEPAFVGGAGQAPRRLSLRWAVTNLRRRVLGTRVLAQPA